MCLLKGFIPGMELYALCHFYFSDLQLLVVIDKVMFCNQNQRQRTLRQIAFVLLFSLNVIAA
jgi:hypothetical protein